MRISFEPFAEGLREPTFLAQARGDAFYVISRYGTVQRIDADGTVQEPPILDITDQVRTEHQDQGLLAMALHPAFDENGRVFLLYTREPDGNVVVSEFLAGPDAVDPDSERVWLVVPQLDVVHNGGALAFDPKGRLVISTGDGGYAAYGHGVSLDPERLSGKVLRIDVDPSRPELASIGSGLVDAEIVARGLRNPWRFSIDPADGTIFIGDSGRQRWEEIDVIPQGRAGRNFGWDKVEGLECTDVDPACDRSAFDDPALVYPTRPGGVIIGGYVHRADDGDVDDGLYIFGDLLGSIYGVSRSDLMTGGALPVELGRIDEPGFLWSFAQDASGGLYVILGSGSIERLVVEPQEDGRGATR
jgi:hypothetical protein